MTELLLYTSSIGHYSFTHAFSANRSYVYFSTPQPQSPPPNLNFFLLLAVISINKNIPNGTDLSPNIPPRQGCLQRKEGTGGGGRGEWGFRYMEPSCNRLTNKPF
uniref:Uncharacterized protein n=2 Tax=Opuntia streptacantha TaxID=393608 RepID=A0A7C8ZIH6_OPUST